MDIMYISSETNTLEPVLCNASEEQIEMFFQAVEEDAQMQGEQAKRYPNAVELSDRVFFLGDAAQTLRYRLLMLDERKLPLGALNFPK